ncbi:MAG: hypothetical protein HW386_987 [Gammaproteobacteria bacterium]|nr:hypothetical protein [Gammaproteobacteria bacterium]
MNTISYDTLIALVMVAAAIVLVAWFLRYKANNSDRRMRNMLERCGLDPETIDHGDVMAIMREVRYHCQKCQNEAVCERWLKGEETGDNSFCPNARTFEILLKSS